MAGPNSQQLMMEVAADERERETKRNGMRTTDGRRGSREIATDTTQQRGGISWDWKGRREVMLREKSEYDRVWNVLEKD